MFSEDFWLGICVSLGRPVGNIRIFAFSGQRYSFLDVFWSGIFVFMRSVKESLLIFYSCQIIIQNIFNTE